MDITEETPSQAARILVHAPPGITRDLIVRFLSRCRSNSANLSADLERGEFEAVRIFGHGLKGTGAAYGIPRLTEIGAMIEAAAASKDASQLRNLVAALAGYLSLLEIASD